MRALLISFILLIGVLPVLSFGQNIGGIGAMLTIDSMGGYTLPYIKGVLPNTPAANSLHESTFIQSVNGVSCKGKSLEDVVALIRGEVGTNIKIRTSDDKFGLYSNEYNLVRAAITAPAANTAPAPDPVAAFNADCEMEAKKLHKMGFKVVKTYNSECGNFFYNFDSEKGLFHVRLFYLSGKEYELNAAVFDNKYEASGVKLTKKGSKDFNGSTVTELNGDISFSKDGVGVVGIKMPVDNTGKCLAMYVIVYKQIIK